ARPYPPGRAFGPDPADCGVALMLTKRPGRDFPSWRLAFASALLVGLAACASTAGEGSSDAGDASNIVQGQSVVAKGAVDTEERRRARIRLELAAGYYQQRNYSVALDELRQALTIDPDYADAYGMLGLVYMELKESDLADQSFRKALALTPNDPELNN